MSTDCDCAICMGVNSEPQGHHFKASNHLCVVLHDISSINPLLMKVSNCCTLLVLILIRERIGIELNQFFSHLICVSQFHNEKILILIWLFIFELKIFSCTMVATEFCFSNVGDIIWMRIKLSLVRVSVKLKLFWIVCSSIFVWTVSDEE